MANDNTFTIRTEKGNEHVEGEGYGVTSSGALEITSDAGVTATFATGRWISVKQEKTEEVKARQSTQKQQDEAGALTDDQREVQDRAERSSRGDNPTLGEPDMRAINGEVETGEAEKPAKGKK